MSVKVGGRILQNRAAALLRLCVWCAITFSSSGSTTPPRLLAGGAGWALRFDGINDFVTLASDPPPPPRTIEFWAKPTEIRDGLGDLLATYNPRGTILSHASLNRGQNLFQIVYNGNEVWHQTSSYDGIRTDEVDPGTDQVLFHFALVEDWNNLTIFINGVEATIGSNPPLKDADWVVDWAAMPWILGARADYIGGDITFDDRCFGGIIDELRWWSVLRSKAEILESMHVSVEEDTPGLHSRWEFDAGRGLADEVSYALGGGDSSRAPVWVPSPVTGAGGPIAAVVRAQTPSLIEICSLLLSWVPAILRFQFLRSPQLGILNVSIAEFFLLDHVVDETGLGGQRYCATVTYVANALSAVGQQTFEQIPFEVVADLSDGGSLNATQTLEVRIEANLAPIAGVARALETNGKDNYASLGTWNIADDWSLALWVAPNAVVDDTTILSRHLSSGGNIFLLMYFGGGYFVRVTCASGCWQDGVETSLTSRLTAPTQADDEMVFDTNLTGAQVRSYRARAHHLALTFRCHERGSETVDTLGEVKVYIDGMLIGQSMGTTCFTAPLDPEAYGPEGYVAGRPAPWELGSEYDGGPQDEHLTNVAVVPSNFFNGVFDDVRFWNRTLSAGEVVVAAEGGDPYDPIVTFNFDLDDPEACIARQLWQPQLRCLALNEAESRVEPAYPFLWTNSLINGGTHVRSPFSKVKGAPIHVSMETGTCATVNLEASDPNGDEVTYHLLPFVDELAGDSLDLDGIALTFCDTNAWLRRDVEVQFDVCDVYGLCASTSSGFGRVVFHVLESGPSILHFQAVPRSASFRITFSEPTNAPNVDSENGISSLLLFEPPLIALFGVWESGGQYLWVYPGPASRDEYFNTNCSAQESSCVWVPPLANVRVLRSGLLRDSLELKYPSTAISPALIDGTCENGTVFFEGVPDCQPCPPGQVVVEQVTEVMCSACPRGQYQSGAECLGCRVGTFSSNAGATACQDCEIQGAISGLGSWDSKTCFCPAGTYEEVVLANGSLVRDGSRCLPCPDGMTCVEDSREANLGRSEGTLVLKPGYMSKASNPLHVYRCRNDAHCPGGIPGTCGLNRDSLSVACGICREGFAAASFVDDTTCEPCEVTYSIWIPLIGIVVVLPGGIFVVSEFINIPRIRESQSTIGPAMVCGVALTVLQTIAVFGNIALEWKDPVRQVVSGARVAEFNTDLFRSGCFAGRNPVSKYVISQLIAPIIAVMLALMFLGKRMLWKRSVDLEVDISNGVGTVYLVFFTTVVLSTVMPFVCYGHPSGESSLRSSPSVLCYVDEEHKALIGVSVVTVVFFIMPFVACVCWGSLRFPLYVSGRGRRGRRGLERFNFLYRRFQPWAYYFSAILLLRALSICLVPVVIQDEPGVHALLLAFLFTAYTFFQGALAPWRLSLANNLDNAMSGVMVFVILLGTLTAEVSVETVMLQFISVLVVGGATAGLIFSVTLASYRRFFPRPVFDHYISHHSAAAAAQARHLKMLLEKHGGKNGKSMIYISCDYLHSVDNSLDIVRSSLRNMVVYLTKDTLRRPLCAGEVTAAYCAGVSIAVVKTTDFSTMEPSDLSDPLRRYVSPPLEGLVAAGVVAKDLADAYRLLLGAECPLIEPNPELPWGMQMEDVAFAVLSKSRLNPKLDVRTTDVSQHSLLVSSNPHEPEGTAAAGILLMSIQQEQPNMLREGSCNLCDFPDLDLDSLSYETRVTVVILTAGSIIALDQISAIVQLGASEAHLLLPVNVGLYVCPPREYYEQELPHMLNALRLDVESGVNTLQQLLQRVALPLSPTSTAVRIRLEVKDIIAHIRKRSASVKARDSEATEDGIKRSSSKKTMDRQSSSLVSRQTLSNSAEYFILRAKSAKKIDVCLDASTQTGTWDNPGEDAWEYDDSQSMDSETFASYV